MQFSVNQCIFCGRHSPNLNPSSASPSSTSSSNSTSSALISQKRASCQLSALTTNVLLIIFSFSPGNVAQGAKISKSWKLAAHNPKFLEILKKQEILSKIHTLFLQENPESSHWKATERMVNEYIQGKLTTLALMGDVTFPRFFHPTRFSSINKSIMQREAILGFGAYVITESFEPCLGGNKTFALTKEAVYPHKAQVLSGKWFAQTSFRCGGMQISENSLLVRVQHDIAITLQTVAHFVSNESEYQQDTTKFLSKFGFAVPVITQEASRYIADLFNRVITTRKLPATWEAMPNDDDLRSASLIPPRFVLHSKEKE